MAYCTVSDVRLELGFDDGELEDDTLISEYIIRAQARIDRICNRTFEADSDTTRTFDAICDLHPRDARILRLDKDLAQITTITNGDSTTIASDEYVTEPRNDAPFYAIKLLSGSGKYWTYTNDPEDAISIEGRWAYSVTAPVEIKMACIRLVAWMYRRKDNMVDFRDTRFSEDGALTVSNAMPFDIYTTLMDYRRRR